MDTNEISMGENPMGTDGFEFVEYTASDVEALAQLFERMGFQAIARHRSKQVVLYRQGDINFILNQEPDSFAQAFAKVHGPSVCAFAVRVRDAKVKQFHAMLSVVEDHFSAIEQGGWL